MTESLKYESAGDVAILRLDDGKANALENFPVRERRELAGWDVERGRIGHAGPRPGAGTRAISLHFPSRSGTWAPETSSLQTAPSATQSAGAETLLPEPHAAEELAAIPRG